jgi:hypothetical protein
MRSYELGTQLRRNYAPSTFMTHMRRLHQDHGMASWAALVALCHGLFIEKYDATEAREAFAMLRDLLPPWYWWRVLARAG